jgi:hypothetical protein
MANVLLSGYLASASSVAWTGATQKIDSLADNEWTDLSDEINNSTNKYPFADLYLELGSAAFTGVDSGIEVYIVFSVDDTNYPTWTGNVTTDETENFGFFVGFMPTTATTAAQKMVLAGVALPSGKFKFGLRNRGNVALAGSANTLYYRPHTRAI